MCTPAFRRQLQIKAESLHPSITSSDDNGLAAISTISATLTPILYQSDLLLFRRTTRLFRFYKNRQTRTLCRKLVAGLYFFFFFKVSPIKNPQNLEIVCALVQSQLPQKMTVFILGLAAGQRD